MSSLNNSGVVRKIPGSQPHLALSPVPPSQAQAPAIKTDLTAVCSEASPVTILLVDDEEVVRNMTARLLERFGYRVIIAKDGLEAVETFRNRVAEIDGVLLDMTMPRLNGEQTFREIRRIKAGAQVIMMSGYNEHEVTRHFTGERLAGFLRKPYTPAELREKLQEVFGEPR